MPDGISFRSSTTTRACDDEPAVGRKPDRRSDVANAQERTSTRLPHEEHIEAALDHLTRSRSQDFGVLLAQRHLPAAEVHVAAGTGDAGRRRSLPEHNVTQRGSAHELGSAQGARCVVSAQTPVQYRYGARGTAEHLRNALGCARVGTHTWEAGIPSQLQRAGSVGRVDSFGHTASGFVYPGAPYVLNPTVAQHMARNMLPGSLVVIHGCGPVSGTYGNTAAFLKCLPKGTTLYNHVGPSGPGMPFNWVQHRLVERNGKLDLESRPLDGQAQVIDWILPEAFVQWWVSAQSTDYLNHCLSNTNQFRITDDVRMVMKAEVDRRRASKPQDRPQTQSSRQRQPSSLAHP